MPQNGDGESLGPEAGRWAQRYGVVRHDEETTRKRAVELARRLAGNGDARGCERLFDLLTAADRLATRRPKHLPRLQDLPGVRQAPAKTPAAIVQRYRPSPSCATEPR